MNEQIQKIFEDPKKAAVVSGSIAFGIGFGVGYFLAKRLEEQKDILEGETYIYERAEKTLIAEDEEDPTNELKQIEVEVDYILHGKTHGKHMEEESDDLIETPPEIFFADDDSWSYEVEVAKRTKDRPYVIHKDEFYADELGYAQITLTYYSGDDVMCDEDESPIYNYLELTGELRFGHGSGDPNVFYVRNDKRRAEYEVLYDDSLYSVEILGYEIEEQESSRDLKHSMTRKFKDV